mmetsp:Transcript_12716/g.38334  ORF Transcript_12716/g.38334 Transcript_12716/m.38334 type:complete len:300 (-) Transcript_12716:1166-2065(-)
MGSTMRSRMVCRRRAPMLSIIRFMSSAIFAISDTASGVNSSLMPSVRSSASCCLSMLDAGSVSVSIRSKSCRVRPLSSTRIGRRPCSSASMSDGFTEWKAPLQMNRMWSVFTLPYLVETVLPSMMGSRSRCTPSLLASVLSLKELTILSISSMNTMPSCSAKATASLCTDSSEMAFSSSTSSRMVRASATVRVRFSFLVLFICLSSCSMNCSRKSGRPTIVILPPPGLGEGTSTTTSVPSSCPFLYRSLNDSRVSLPLFLPHRASRICSSTAAEILAASTLFSFWRVRLMELSTKSRII